MRPRNHHTLHILLGLTPRATAAEIILAADRETGRTQSALDALLRMRAQQEQSPSYESTSDAKNTDQDTGSVSISEEVTEKMSKYNLPSQVPHDSGQQLTAVASPEDEGKQGSSSQSGNTRANDQLHDSHDEFCADPNLLQPNVKPRTTWKTIGNTLKHRAFTLIRTKANTIVAWKGFSGQVPKHSHSTQSPGSTDNFMAFKSSPLHPDEDTTPPGRAGLDIPRGSIHPELTPVACGIHVGGAILHVNCPPPCRNGTTLTQFPRLQEDSQIEEESDEVPAAATDDFFFDRAMLEDIVGRSRRIQARKTVFGLFPGQD